MKRIKDFRDLIHIYQRKNKQDTAILPINEFRTILKGIGITLSNQVSYR